MSVDHADGQDGQDEAATGTDAAGTDAAEEGAARRRHRRRRLVIGIPVGLVAIGVLVPTAAYIFRFKPGPEPVASAVERFRDSSAPASGPDTFTRPPAGVYTARGQGEERISTPPNSQQDGTVMPVSVQHLAQGCWRWRIDYNVAHWHEYEFCPQGAQLLLTGQRNDLTWDFGLMSVTNVGSYQCQPPAPIAVEHPKVGQRFAHHCVGNNSAAPGVSVADGPAEILGHETLTIGTRHVLSIHQNRVETMTGPQKGSVTEEWWFAADTGMPLKATRKYRLSTSSPIGAINYVEDGSWQLSSTTPST